MVKHKLWGCALMWTDIYFRLETSGGCLWKR